MKKLLLAVVVGLALPSAAFAADLYAKAAPTGYAAYDWTGFYIGGHVGGARQNTQMTDPTPATRSPGSFMVTMDALVVTSPTMTMCHLPATYQPRP